MTDTASTDTGSDATATDAGTDTSTDTGTDTAAEIEKWKQQSRKHEQRARENAQKAKDFDTLKQQSMTDTEKAVEAARNEARAEALREAGSELTEAAIRVAAAGRVADIDALLEGVDAAKFIGENGKPDHAAIKKWIDRIAPAGAGTTTGRRDLGQGARGQQASTSLGDPLVEALNTVLGTR